ncbi:tyrosine-type recombinase/integrase [Kitasatospora sp. NPDC088779]|uniref:tyrosine-type recombinase/integrase n=1 Tax=Kitasatospora sp. NPDC088779 TaxID=3154964 RepID=UPI003421C852
MSEPYDRWHKSRPAAGEKKCTAHKKVASSSHGQGKRWLARWRDHDGKQLSESFDKYDDAKQHLAKIETSVTEGTYIAKDKGATLIKSLAEQWLTDLVFRNPRTEPQYIARVNRYIIEPLGHIKIKDLIPSRIVSWIKGMLRTIGETYAGLIFSHFNSIITMAVDDGLILKNPCASRSVQRVKPRRQRKTPKELPVDWEDSEGIKQNLPDRYKVTVDCGRGIGMRQGEIFAFSPDDVNWLHKEKVVHIRRQIAHDRGVMVFAPPKGGGEDDPKDRMVPIGDDLAFLLAEHIRLFPPVDITLPWIEKNGPPVTVKLFFTSREHKPINKNYYNWLWKAALEEIGLIQALNDKPVGRGRLWEKCRDKMMHSLRHLFASEALNEGVDIYTLADLLGHEDPAFTLRRYVHRVARSFSKAREAIGRRYKHAA